MPPQFVPLDSSDEDEQRYPLRSSRRIAQRQLNPDNESDELESDAEDDLAPALPPPPKPSPPRRQRPGTTREEMDQRRKERKRKKEQAKEEKRKRKRAEKKAAAEAAAKQTGGFRPSQPPATTSPSAPGALSSSVTSQQPTIAGPSRITDGGTISDDDDDDNGPTLVVRRSTSREPSQGPRQSPAPMSEDEPEIVPSQPPRSHDPDTAQARSSSTPIVVEPDAPTQTSPRASSARPEGPEQSGGAANPIHLDSSDAPLPPDLAGDLDDVSISDVSSVSYDDSEEYEVGAEFYTSSEGSTHGSDSEDGLGAWTEYDKENWQGSTAQLDEAYDGNYDVRAVLRHRKNPRRGFIEYRTAWAGYPIYSSTWEPESHFNSKRTLREYWDRQGGRPADVPYDPNEYSTHDSDTDVAVSRRPRWRAHAAKKKKRREVRRDKVQLRQYLMSLSEERAKAKAKEEERYAKFRRANRLTLDTERVREKGTSRSYQKRMEKMKQKRWRRNGGGDDTAGPSRFNVTNTSRTLADVSMRARTGPASGITSARTRVSQLNDSIPENDENQMTFRRSAPNFPGLSSTTMAPIRERPGFASGTARPTVRPPATAGASGPSGSSAALPTPMPRAPPGSYKGAHRRDPKVQVMEYLDHFTKASSAGGNVQQRQTVVPAPPLQVPTDSTGRPISAPRRPSEVRKPNLLVLKPVEDFKGGSRPVPSASTAYAASSASSESGDQDKLGIPELSAVRSNYNPHQPAPESDDDARRAKQVQSAGSASAPGKRVGFAARVEDPRRRPPPPLAPQAPVASTASTSQAPWSPVENDVQFSPQDDWDTAVNVESSPVHIPPQSPMDFEPHERGHQVAPARAVQTLIWKGWLEFVVGHNRVDTEGAFFAAEPLSPDRMQALGLGVKGTTLQFDMVMPFALIRDSLAGHGVVSNEAMILHAHGAGAQQDRASIDQLSEQLRYLDVALLARAGDAAGTGDTPERRNYFVAFSSKYQIDYISGVPPSLQGVCGHPYTLCILPLHLDQHPAPSALISFEQPPPLDPKIIGVFEDAAGKRAVEDLKLGRHELRRVRRAAQRYRVGPQLREYIQSAYNIIFLGRDPPSYEKSVLYYMVRIFEGGVRFELNPKTDAKLFNGHHGVNVFVRRAALDQMLENEQRQHALALGPFLAQLKRQPRCRFWTYGFSSQDPDERIRELFPGRDGLVTFSMSSILTDLLRSSMVVEDKDEQEEGQWSQADKTPPQSILCNAAYHLADNWRVRLHPWIRPCFKLLADHLEPVCRALNLIEEHQDFPIELMLELDSKLEALYTSALVEEWPSDAVHGLPFEEPTEVPDEPAELVRRIDKEVLATLQKVQLTSAADTRFHVLTALAEHKTENGTAGVEVITLEELSQNRCMKLAELPGY